MRGSKEKAKQRLRTRGPAVRICIACAGLVLARPAVAEARHANGNDFALFYVEARTEAARQTLVEEAGRRPHFFRYLQIMEMEETGTPPRAQVRIVALEPASGLDVVFTVSQPAGLGLLREEPPSRPGTALAVLGVLSGIDPRTRALQLDPVVLRYKDRLAPVSGKEMLYELDERGLFYSFTGDGEAVMLGYRDRDLLQHRARVMEEGGDRAWAGFLRRAIAEREAGRRAGEAPP